MQRLVQAEILDSLDPAHPIALANRRDLLLINRLMGNFRWIGSALRTNPPVTGITELGAGDGMLGHYLLNENILSTSHRYSGVDLIARPGQWPTEWPWVQEDLRRLSLSGDCDVLVANLILHQFEEMDLRQLGNSIGQSTVQRLIINEPVRRSLHIYQVFFSRILGVHPVTLHDARVSIRAGFRQGEVCDTLGLPPSDWEVSWQETFMGANRVICHRK